MQDLLNNSKVVTALQAIVLNNDTEGTGLTVDLSGYESCMFVIQCGISGDTLSGSVYHSFLMEESDNGSSWSAVAAADIQLPNTAAPYQAPSSGIFAVVDDPAEDDVALKAGYIGAKRYVRVRDDVTGTHTNGTPISATAILSKARHAPVG